MKDTVTVIQTAAVSLAARADLVVHGARGAHDRSDFLLVRVLTSAGIAGYGEVSVTPLWSSEDGTSAKHFIETVVAPALVGRPLVPAGSLESIMDKLLAGNPFTKAGVFIALWDAHARTLDVPLGGSYRTEVPIKLSLSGDGDGDDLDRTYAGGAGAGFRSFKVKVGTGVDGDVARFARARKLNGAGRFLGMDANGGWSRTEAARAIRELAQYDSAFVEQPLQPDDLEGMRAVRANGIPIVADESVFGCADLVRLIRADAADVVSLYVGKSGSPGGAVAMGRLAAAFGLETLIGPTVSSASVPPHSCTLPARCRICRHRCRLTSSAPSTTRRTFWPYRWTATACWSGWMIVPGSA